MIEKNRTEIWEVAKNLHEKVSCVMCDNISKLIDTVQPGLMEEKEKALSNPNLVQENINAMEITWNTNLSKLDIIREIISAIREL